MTDSSAPKPIKYVGDKKSIEKVRELLASVVGATYTVDQGVAYHTDPPNKISLPEGMKPGKAAKLLLELEKAGQQIEVYNHQFRYRPEDGAHAVMSVMKKYFGTAGRGKTIQTFFGAIPPQKIAVYVSPTEQIQVPWGQIDFQPLEGVINLGSHHDPEFGVLFSIAIKCPNWLLDLARAFCLLVEDELRNNSIYRGQSITLTRNTRDEDYTCKFLDLVPNPTIVYNEDVQNALYTTVWGILEHRDLMKADNRKVNNRVLMHGPYGTGKSEAGTMTAFRANNNDATFIQFHSGRGTLDDLEATVAMARLYSPSVVFVEDIDVYASNTDESFQTRLSNLFDGIGSKGDEVMIVMTSNKAANFSKGMLRAGRIDSMIEIGALDREATEELVRRVIGEERLDSVNFDKVWDAMDGFEPAFVRQTFDKAAVSALLRTGSRDYKLTTEDFVTAANLLRPQHDMHAQTDDSRKRVTFDSLLSEKVREGLVDVLQGAGIEDVGDLYLREELLRTSA